MVQAITAVRADFVMEEQRDTNKITKWENRVCGAGQLTKIYCLITASAVVIAIGILLTIDINHHYSVEAYFLMFMSILLVRAAVYYLAGSLMSKSKQRSSVLIEWWISLTIFFVALETTTFMMVNDYIPEAQTLLVIFFVADIFVQVCLLSIGWGFALTVKKQEKNKLQNCHVLEIHSDNNSDLSDGSSDV